MKRVLSLVLILAALLSLSACLREDDQPEGMAFYYCAARSDYNVGSTALTAEYRTDVAEDPLQQALERYLDGPVSAELRSPFPEELKLMSAYREGSTVYLTFSRELTDLSGLELTMACGCLTLTTLALTGAQQVEIRSVSGLLDGQRAITMDKNTLLLMDTAAEGE